MELVFQNKLTHYLGAVTLNERSGTCVSLSFRDSSGERFSIELPSASIPSAIYSERGPALHQALQEVLDKCVRAGVRGSFQDVDSRTPPATVSRARNDEFSYY